MNLTRWDPFRELEDMRNRLDRLFGRTAVPSEGGKEALSVADWVPVVDITENPEAYVLKAELPEIDKKDVNLTIQDGVLTIRGERHGEKEESGKKFHRVERSYGKFMRTFTLPSDADEENVRASHKDGVLTVQIAKTEKAKPRAIDVKVE
jgi:HSP20 family protein